jgi:hypothetical protein
MDFEGSVQENVSKFLERDENGYYPSEYVIYGDREAHPREEFLESFSQRHEYGIWIPSEKRNCKTYRKFIYKTETYENNGNNTRSNNFQKNKKKKKRMIVSSLIK